MLWRWFGARRAVRSVAVVLAGATCGGIGEAGAEIAASCSPFASASALYAVQSNAPPDQVTPALACLRQSAERSPIDRFLLDAITMRLVTAEAHEGFFPYKIKQDLAFAQTIFDEVERWPASEDRLRLAGAALRAKALLLYRDHDYQAELTADDEIIRRFDTFGDVHSSLLVASAKIDRGLALEKLKRPADALVSYGEVIERFGKAKEPSIRAVVASALLRKGILLQGLGQKTAADGTYGELLSLVGGAGDADLQWRAALALNNRAVLQGGPDELRGYATLIDRFKASPDPRIQEIVAQVMSATIKLHRAQRHSVQAEQAVDALVAFAKATDNGFAKQEAASAMLGRASWREEAHDRPGTIAALDAVVAAFEGQTSMLAAVVEAMERKASLLAEAGRTDEAIALWNDVISRSDATGVLRTMVAPGAQSQDVSVLKALFNKAVAELGRGHREAAAQGFADVVRRYEAAPDESWQAWILAALEHQADIANALGQDDAAAGFYGKIVRLYSGSKQPGLRYGAAKSLLNRGALSARADRYADALADFSTVDALFGEDQDPAMRDNLAPAAVNRARALLRLGRKAEAVAAVDQFLLRYGKGPAKASPALIADARQIRREAKAR